MPVEISAGKNSRQSALRSKVPEPLPAELFDRCEPLLRGRALDVFAIERFAFLPPAEPHDTLYAHVETSWATQAHESIHGD